MSFENVPAGNGKHPIALVVISASNLAASSTFYAKVFGWQIQPMSAELMGFVPPGGPGGALRSSVETGFPGMVPYIAVPKVDTALQEAVASGATIEKAPWSIPGVGNLARFKDAGGTIYGLTDGIPPSLVQRIPMPFGSGPKPPAGALCSIEMYAADGPASARFFAEQFGWGTLPTMPQYIAVDPGAGLCGVFQSHTPALPALAYQYSLDVAAALKQIEEAGGKRLGDAISMPGFATFGYFQDPSGTHMGLIGP